MPRPFSRRWGRNNLGPSAAPELSIISVVVAPAILILASSSLITTTANRLSLLLDRVRSLTREVEEGRLPENKRAFISSQLGKASKRAPLLQRALATLYLALGSLILTSVAVGIGAVTGYGASYIGFTVILSVALLFYASMLLIRESRIALRAVNAEMEYVRRLIG